MVVAKTDRAHQRARRAVRRPRPHRRRCERGYLAFVWGVPDRPRGTIDAPIDRHPQARDKMAVRAGRPRGGHPLGGAGALSRRRRQAGREPGRLPAGDRPHPPDPRPSGPYRPSAAGRRRLRRRASGPRPSLLGRKRAGGAGRPLAGRPCMPICWASSIPARESTLEFRSELPADLAVYVQPWPRTASGHRESPESRNTSN